MPSVTRNAFFATAISLSISACASSAHQREVNVVPYDEQVRSLRGTAVAPVHLLRATKDLLVDRHYEVLDEDPNLGYLEATSPVDSSFGMHTREHWLILINAERVTVAKSLQERVKDDWLEYSFVDRTYSYALETELLNSIASAANQLAGQDQSAAESEVAATKRAR